MAVNTYFNKTNHFNEQQLLESLVIESIQIHGIDVYYVPRTYVNKDFLFGEDAISTFNNAYKIECILEDYTAWGGERELINNFGFMMADQAKIIISRKRFNDLVIEENDNLTRPREGDLIVGALQPKRLWEIKFVDDELSYDFYQLGNKYTWELTLELFEWDEKTIDTGVTEIDAIGDSLMREGNLLDESGNNLLTEASAEIIWSGATLDDVFGEAEDNTNLDDEDDEIFDWTENSPFGEL